MKRARLPLLLLLLGVAACHRSCSYSGSSSLSFGPDAGTFAFTSSADAAVDAATGAAAGGADAGAVPARFTGVFHLPGPDEVNLALEPDGTFHWRFSTCSSSRAACGQWSAKGSLIVLTPLAGAPTLDWVDDAAPKAKVTHVDVADHAGRLEMRAYRDDATSAASVWLPGRVCGDCKGPLPAAPVACNTPFPSTCR